MTLLILDEERLPEDVLVEFNLAMREGMDTAIDYERVWAAKLAFVAGWMRAKQRFEKPDAGNDLSR